MRLLVAGSRHGVDGVWDALDAVHQSERITLVITGGAPGVDETAEAWGLYNGVNLATWFAAWKEHGRAAGPIRNQQMIDEGKPDAAYLFPGGNGTADMRKRLEKAGIRIIGR